MKKTIGLLLIMIAIIISVCACQTDSSINKEQILDDYNAYMGETGYSYTDYEVELSDSNEETFEASVSISGNSEYADVVDKVTVYYNKYDQGWVLEDVNVTDRQFTLTSGMTKEEFSGNAGVYLPECTNVEYVSDAIDFDNGTQNFEVSYEKGNKLLTCTGTKSLQFEFEFESNTWNLADSVIVDEDLTFNVCGLWSSENATSWVEGSEPYLDPPRFTVLSISDDNKEIEVTYNGAPRTLAFKDYFDGQELTGRQGILKGLGNFEEREADSESGSIEYVLYDSEGDYVDRIHFEYDSESDTLIGGNDGTDLEKVE